LLSDNGHEFKGEFTNMVECLKGKHTRTHAGRPQPNGNVEALHKTILERMLAPRLRALPAPKAAATRAMEPA
jgi:hypothetical protein